ncbi:MAG TPA: uroporphyrinogen decarboxylase family protein [Acidobacteriota bacterium]|nr:uroporphyrinogen decarboxylase family protein [Acidobacteriota bacterium]
MMTGKERLRAALEHKQPDAVPIDLGGTSVTGISAVCIAALRDYYGLEKRLVKVFDPLQLIGIVDDDLKEVLGIDIDGIVGRTNIFGFANENWKPWRLPNGLEVLVSEHFNTTVDDEDSTYLYPQGDTTVPPSGKLPKDGFYFDAIIRQDPIDEEKLNPEDNLEEFGPISEEDLVYFESEVRRCCASGRGIVASLGGMALGDIALVPGLGLKHPKGIRDIEEWYISTVTRRDYIKKVFERQTEIALQNLEKIFERVGNAFDAVFICGTDFGTQSSTFCSLDSFRDLYLPYYRRMNDWIHQNTTWKTFKHSCGAVEPLIEGFIEAGFDILNPVQISAPGMEPEKLKQKYGDRLVFWGGGVDTQKTLPFGTPQQVREEVLRSCEIFGKGGGFVFNTVHNIQANTPVENIVAMFEAIKEFNGAR